MSSPRQKWAVVARMNIAFLRQAHAAYFPMTLTLAEGLLLRVILQHICVWDLDGKPATVSKISRALGTSRATTRRRLAELMVYGYVKQQGAYYVCGDRLVEIQHKPAIVDRFVAILNETQKELANLATNVSTRG